MNIDMQSIMFGSISSMCSFDVKGGPVVGSEIHDSGLLPAIVTPKAGLLICTCDFLYLSLNLHSCFILRLWKLQDSTLVVPTLMDYTFMKGTYGCMHMTYINMLYL